MTARDDYWALRPTKPSDEEIHSHEWQVPDGTRVFPGDTVTVDVGEPREAGR
jgi:hypothetical protein